VLVLFFPELGLGVIVGCVLMNWSGSKVELLLKMNKMILMNKNTNISLIYVVGLILGVMGCQETHHEKLEPVVSGKQVQKVVPSTSVAAPTVSAHSGRVHAKKPALSAKEWGRLVTSLSEKTGDFPSDNLSSNETSYLHISPQLQNPKLHGGVYLGVGPEQNFTYISLLEPEIAFLVDIRRDNLVMHLLYKTVFEQAKTRAEFVANLASRTLPTTDLSASISAIHEQVMKNGADTKQSASLAKAVEQRAKELNFELTSADRTYLRKAIKIFATQGLNVRYAMQGSNRHYPSLVELADIKDDKGKALHFLASEANYSKIRAFQVQNRIVPVVGNLAGTHALSSLAKELKQKNWKVQNFYVSNVEQYIFAPPDWKQWLANLNELPWGGHASLIRVYFDQGRDHPLQRKGHRTTTMVHDASAFLKLSQEKPWKSWWKVATESPAWKP
jgi:hypothetical protein